MKKISSILVLLFMAFAVSPALAQNDPEAKKILDAVSANYRSHQLMKAAFSFSFKSPSGELSETQDGSLYVQPGTNRYRIKMAAQEMISDGTTAWVYLPEVNEVQVTNAQANSAELNPAQAFTLHEKGFKYLLKGETSLDGRSVQLIDLVPLESQSYSKIELAVEKGKQLIRQLKVFDKGGSQSVYKITSVSFDQGGGSGLFTFNKSKYPDAEVVDLR